MLSPQLLLYALLLFYGCADLFSHIIDENCDAGLCSIWLSFHSYAQKLVLHFSICAYLVNAFDTHFLFNILLLLELHRDDLLKRFWC